MKTLIFLVIGTLLTLLFGCNNHLEKCLITEYVGFDPDFSEIVKHINQDLIREGCAIRVEADVSLNGRKMAGRVKIGSGSLLMFSHGVMGVFNCESREEKNKLIFFQEANHK